MVTFLLITLGLLLFTGIMKIIAASIPDHPIRICEARDENLHSCLKEAKQARHYHPFAGLSFFLYLCPEHCDKAIQDEAYSIILDTRRDVFAARKAELEESQAKAKEKSLKKARKDELKRLRQYTLGEEAPEFFVPPEVDSSEN